MIFQNYDDAIHSEVEQIKRFERSIGKKINLISFDISAQLAIFEGSSGDIYNTNLTRCNCVDFALRRLPCKHMYRLAIECGLIDVCAEPWKTYATYTKVLNRAKNKLSTLNIDQLQELIDYLDVFANNTNAMK